MIFVLLFVAFNNKRFLAVIFNEQTHAYITTNEDLRTPLEFFMPVNCNRALTVAASGDHPLFCSLYGAKYVDTFDISYNAKCIMDIKTAAINLLNRDEYVEMLENLWWRPDALKAPYMDRVSAKLPAKEYEYLCAMRGTRLFDQDPWCSRDSKYLPNDIEYRNLRKIIKKPYNFIQTNIVELSGQLTESYDLVHLSNIFDHIDDPDDHWRILFPLLKHINIGGRVVSYQLFGYSKQFPEDSTKDAGLIYDILKNYKLKRYMVGLTSVDNLVVFERIR